MAMHALLIGVADDDAEEHFRPAPSLAAMRRLLDSWGGWTTTVLTDAEADRAHILAALDELERRVGPGDGVLFYFVGHGGIVELQDLPGPLGGRQLAYLATARKTAEWSLEGILDVELSEHLTRIDARCTNVTTVLDCCYSSRIVRGPVYTLAESPAWLRDLADARAARRATAHPGLRPTGHSRIVRLSATSNYRMSYAHRRDDGHLGRLTALFVEVMAEVGPAIGRVSWDTVAHRIRERAIWELRFEEQWVTLAGPRARCVFSTAEVAPPRTVGFVPHEHQPGGWIRAGALQGVELGDRWALAELAHGPDGEPRWSAQLRVVGVELNRAYVEGTDGGDAAKIGAAAHMLRAQARACVALADPPAELRAAIDRSSWVCEGAQAPMARVEAGTESLRLRHHSESIADSELAIDEAGVARAVALLESWAQTRRLLAVAARYRFEGRAPFRLRLGLAGSTPRWFDSCDRVTARCTDRLLVAVTRAMDRQAWFVSVIIVDVDGRSRLLDASEPDGRELLPGRTEIFGGGLHGHDTGIALEWPTAAVDDGRERSLRIIALASQRPLSLGHLVGPASPPITARAHRRRPRRGRLAELRPRTGPELALASAAVLMSLGLSPPSR